MEAALHALRKGDRLVVCKLDRLAWSVVHLGQILESITEAGASLRILSMGVDTSTATGKLMLNVIGSVAQFEREMMVARTLGFDFLDDEEGWANRDRKIQNDWRGNRETRRVQFRPTTGKILLYVRIDPAT